MWVFSDIQVPRVYRISRWQCVDLFRREIFRARSEYQHFLDLFCFWISAFQPMNPLLGTCFSWQTKKKKLMYLFCSTNPQLAHELSVWLFKLKVVNLKAWKGKFKPAAVAVRGEEKSNKNQTYIYIYNYIYIYIIDNGLLPPKTFSVLPKSERFSVFNQCF